MTCKAKHDPDHNSKCHVLDVGRRHSLLSTKLPVISRVSIFILKLIKDQQQRILIALQEVNFSGAIHRRQFPLRELE